MLFNNRSIDIPNLERVIDYTPLVVAPATTAIAAIALMDRSEDLTAPAHPTRDRQNYSYVLVVAANRPIGILTRRDVVKLVAAGTNLTTSKIEEVMTAPVITINITAMTDAIAALSLMRQHRIGHLSIVDERGLLIGMVTADDLLQCYERLELLTSPPPEREIGSSQIDRRNGQFVGTRCLTRDITSQQTEEDLKRFNAALSHAMEGIALLDPQGHYVWTNTAYAEAIGYTPEALVGQDWQRTVHPEDLHTVELAYAQMLARGKVEVAARGVRQDGSIFYKQLVMVAASDDRQQLTGHYCFMKDVTPAKQAEADLIESEQKFRAIFDSMLQFIGLLTPDGILIEGNQAVFDAVAVDRSAIIGKPFWETPWWTHSPQLQERVKAAVATAAAGELVQFESEHIWADGTPAVVDFSLKPMFDATGKVTMLIPEGRDITDRKRKEDILRNIALGVSAKTGEAFFEALVEYLTKALQVEYAFISELLPPTQDRVRTIAGYGHGTTIDQFEYALLDTPCQCTIDCHFCVCAERLQQQFPSFGLLREISAQSYMGVILRNSAGQPLGLICVLSCQNFSETQLMKEILNIFAARAAAEIERQRSEIELQHQKQDLARSNDELQQFAYVASHDLQEPLRMITSYLELLERRYKGQLDAKADTFIAYAVDGASRMQTLINDLLNYSRVGRQDRDFQAVDCEQIFEQVLANLQVAIAKNNAIVTCAPLPQVYGNSSQLVQLFQNLLGNAIAFHREEPPQIEISVASVEGQWLFSVRDNGIGIENEYLDRIFIIFQRLHSKTEYPGTGIGLAVCKKIVERHGGQIWVESQPDRGSTFYFTLPFPTSHIC